MADPELEQFDHEWKHGDRARARDMARAYVMAHRPLLAHHLEGRTLDELVGMVSAYRAAGREDDPCGGLTRARRRAWRSAPWH